MQNTTGSHWLSMDFNYVFWVPGRKPPPNSKNLILTHCPIQQLQDVMCSVWYSVLSLPKVNDQVFSTMWNTLKEENW